MIFRLIGNVLVFVWFATNLGSPLFAQDESATPSEEDTSSTDSESEIPGAPSPAPSEEPPMPELPEPVESHGGIGGIGTPAEAKVVIEGDAAKGAAAVPEGRELVNIDFPELTDIQHIIKAVALWTGKNVILDRNVSGKIQIISPRKVTKEEAYQAFLSALNMLGLTTVETGKVIKILKVRNAVRDNLKTYMGSSWAPRTDEVITQIIPLKYIDAKQVQSTLARIVSSNAMIAYEPTNTLIVSDSGYKVRRVLEILELLDVQTQQPKVLIVPVQYSDPKSIADKVNQILQASGANKSKTGGGFNTFKIMTDERTNSVIIFGPPRTIKDIKDLVQKFDIKVEDPTSQATIHVRPLDYADAKKLAATLSSLATGNKNSSAARRPPMLRQPGVPGGDSQMPSVTELSDGVKITAEDSSNALLITGSRSAYNALNSLIRKLDVRRSQVFLEVEILDLAEDNEFSFGTSIFGGAGRSDGTGSKTVVGWEANKMGPLIVASSATDSSKVSNTDKKEIASAFANDMTIGIISGTSVNVPGLGKFTPGALINLIKTDTNNKSLASPHILTANNEESSISVGERIFFNTSVINPTTGTPIPKVEKENVDLTLTMKPNISHSNYVTLKLDLESSSVTGASKEGLPVISKRKSKQNVTVKNGQTVVVSGLVKTSESESYSKIPLLGDIPIIGWLFRNSSIRKIRTNLAVFITPHVVHGAEDLAAIYKTKVKERDQYLETVYGDDYKSSEFYSKLPTEEDGSYKPSSSELNEDSQRSEIEGAMETVPVHSSTEEISVPIPMGGGSGGGDTSGGALPSVNPSPDAPMFNPPEPPVPPSEAMPPSEPTNDETERPSSPEE